MGKITVVTGTMFSGKTSKLIEMAENLRLNNILNFSIYRPQVNIVDGQGVVLTHNQLALPALPLMSVETLQLDKNKYIFIDSFQNLPYQFVDAIEELVIKEDKEFYLFGTRTDVRGNFQQTICKVMSIADEIILLSTKCTYCNNKSIYHVLKDGLKISDDINKIKGEKYEPLCRKCFYEKFLRK